MVSRSGKTCDFVSKFNFVAGIEIPGSIQKGGKLGVALLYPNKSEILKPTFSKKKIERLWFLT